MPTVEAEVTVPVRAAVAFAVSQTHGEVRYRTARSATAGIRSCASSTSWAAPPTNVGMKMVDGPWYFDIFGGGWRFTAAADSTRTRVTWRYNFRCRSAWLRPIVHPIGRWLLGREIRRRINGYYEGCHDAIVLAEAERTASQY